MNFFIFNVKCTDGIIYNSSTIFYNKYFPLYVKFNIFFVTVLLIGGDVKIRQISDESA